MSAASSTRVSPRTKPSFSIQDCVPDRSLLVRGHSSAGRAPAWHAGGQRFDPAWLHQIPPRSIKVLASYGLQRPNVSVSRSTNIPPDVARNESFPASGQEPSESPVALGVRPILRAPNRSPATRGKATKYMGNRARGLTPHSRPTHIAPARKATMRTTARYMPIRTRAKIGFYRPARSLQPFRPGHP
jgi:hypothetical protein